MSRGDSGCADGAELWRPEFLEGASAVRAVNLAKQHRSAFHVIAPPSKVAVTLRFGTIEMRRIAAYDLSASALHR